MRIETKILTTFLSAGISITALAYEEYKNDRLQISLDKGRIYVKGTNSKFPFAFNFKAPDLTDFFDKAKDLSDKYLK